MELPRDRNYTVHINIADPDGIRLIWGDITEYPADAIVNAANADLLPGGGVCGAIHRAGGPAIAEECSRIRTKNGPLLVGQAVATTGGRLQSKYVIHTVGPVWKGGTHGEAMLLSSCYRQSMRVADDLKLHSIAFPAISTGIFGYPLEQAAWVAIPTVIESLRTAKNLIFIMIVLFDRVSLDAFAEVALAQRRPASGQPYEIHIGVMDR